MAIDSCILLRIPKVYACWLCIYMYTIKCECVCVNFAYKPPSNILLNSMNFKLYLLRALKICTWQSYMYNYCYI